MIICIVWVDKTKVVTQKDYLSNWVIKKLGRNQMFPGLCIGDMFDAPIDSLWWSDQEKSVRQVVDTAVRQRHLSENCNLTPKWSLCFPSELTSLCVFYQCGYVHMCMYVPACRGQCQALSPSTLFLEWGPSLIQLGCLLRNELQEPFSVITLLVLTALCSVLQEDWRPRIRSSCLQDWHCTHRAGSPSFFQKHFR